MTSTATAGSVWAAAGRSPVGRKNTISFWLLLVLYPLALPLGTYPVIIGGVSVGVEFLFSIVCAVVMGAETATGRLKLRAGNPHFALGLALWMGANLAGLLMHPELGAESMVFRMGLKALFGYMAFWVLSANGRLDVLLKTYVAGCVLSGLATVVFAAQAGSLEAIRQASYGGLDPDALDIDVFRGFARAGAGNMLPVWICAALYPSVTGLWKRVGLRTLLVFFAVVAMLALRREVLVETVVGLGVMWFVMPRRFRSSIVLAGLLFGVTIIGTVALSQAWQDRLFGETRDEYESGMDPRTVLLLNTPAELMEEPFLGHGPSSYPMRMTKYFGTNVSLSADYRGIAPHNSFSRAAVETGTLGLVGLGLIVAALGWRAALRKSQAFQLGIDLRLVGIMIFLHVGDWLFFGDGIASNTTWYFIGVLLYLDRCLSWEASQVPIPRWQMKQVVR